LLATNCSDNYAGEKAENIVAHFPRCFRGVYVTHPPQLILFDCDGTLMDSHHHIIAVMQQAFIGSGFESPADNAIAGVIGLSLEHAVQHLLPQAETPVHDVLQAEYRRLYRILPSEFTLFEGVHETLAMLQERGYWLGIVTGKSLAGLQRVLDEFNLAAFFLVLRTADQCPSKPHPAMVNECMHEMGVESMQTTVIGDACMDMQMACAAGARAIGVSFGVEDAAALRTAGAGHVVDSFAALLEHFPHLQSLHVSSTMR